MTALLMTRRKSLWQNLRSLILPALFLGLAACDSSTEPDDNHSDFSRVEIESRGTPRTLLAVWEGPTGWRNGSGNPIQELPNLRQEGDGSFQPLRVGGPNASLTVRFFDMSGNLIPIATAARDANPPRDRTCTEDEARYAPIQNNTNIITWPPRRHPDSPNGPFHWARRPNGSDVAIFHCDHVHIYPEAAGTVDLAFVLWHGDHSDGETSPIRLRVFPAQ